MLRLVYVSTFMAQVLVATLVAVLVRAAAGGTPRPSQILAWVLVALALMQLPIAAVLVSRQGAITSRQTALARTLFTAILLSATAWSTALALATGQRGLSVYVLLTLVMLAYALGFLSVGRLASRAAALPPQSGAAGGPSGGGPPGRPPAEGPTADRPTAEGEEGCSALEAGVLEDVDHVERLGGA